MGNIRNIESEPDLAKGLVDGCLVVAPFTVVQSADQTSTGINSLVVVFLVVTAFLVVRFVVPAFFVVFLVAVFLVVADFLVVACLAYRL